MLPRGHVALHARRLRPVDFANSFDLQLSDLESVGELGYVEGITKIFMDKLNSMDIYKRPIHCSDAKREIIYVKDDNKWEREERNKKERREERSETKERREKRERRKRERGREREEEKEKREEEE